MGAAFMDYIIVDPTLVNDDEQTYFTERLVYLPDSYQPNDRRREISDRHFSRRDVGLPDNGFVYCCFNSSYKLMPEFFDIWMRVLREADDSVLWLLQTGDAARRNLGDEAERRGISRNRIVFAEHLPLPEHLSRLRLADLFLDTLPYNAHTTASDALWAGVPVLTCRGSTMAGRVAASLLRAIGLDELIMTSLSDYEGAAMQFAKDPALVADIKGRIQRNRQNCALFDTPRFARHIEAAFATMWQRHRRGEPPASFAVDRLAGPS
jgi:predicted O-linked N-acetylglucosamine transferase (SPINDLY family)